MDVKELASVAAAPVVFPPPPESTAQTPVSEIKPIPQLDVGPYALRPVVKVDTDGLALLQLQDTKTGDIVFQIPSAEAARQYRESETHQGKGVAPTEQMAAAVASAAVAAGAAAVTAAALPQFTTAPQPAKDNVVMAQAVKAVEPQSGSKQPGSVRVKA